MNDVKSKKLIKIDKNILFIIGYLLFFIQFWSKGLLKINEYIFHIPAIICIITSIDIKKLNKKDILIIFILYLLGIINYIFSKSMNILKISIILSALKNKDIDKIIKSTFWCGIITLIIHIISSSIFNIGTLYKEMDYGRGIVERRYFFGFSHTNTVQSLFNVILISWIYTYFVNIKENKTKLISTILMIILIIIAYMFTKSRTGLIISILSVILPFVLCTKKYNIFKNYKIIDTFYIIILLTIIIFVYFLPNTSIYNKLNSFMTGRLEFATLYIKNYGLTLYGQEKSNTFNLNGVDEKNIVLDQGIISPLISYGIIINILFYISQLKLIKKYCLENNYKRVMIILIMILYAITEDILFYPFVNFSLLFIGDLIYNNESYTEGKDFEDGRKNFNINTDV